MSRNLLGKKRTERNFEFVDIVGRKNMNSSEYLSSQVYTYINSDLYKLKIN